MTRLSATPGDGDNLSHFRLILCRVEAVTRPNLHTNEQNILVLKRAAMGLFLS
jgi:hypothetical protein